VVTPSEGKSLATITVTRAGKAQDYSVPTEGIELREATGSGLAGKKQ
jgi:hypothetical protein